MPHANANLKTKAFWPRPGPLLIADTDAFATCVWEERYLGTSDPVTEHIAANAAPDLYLLTSHEGVPFEQDGLRDGEHLRAWMTHRFRERLRHQPVAWVELHGTGQERLEQATKAVNALMAAGWSFAPRLHENGRPKP